MSSRPSPSSPELSSNPGLRAAEAFVRPSPIATHGNVIKYGFDLRNCTFSFTLAAESATREDLPTEIYLPDYHFPAGQTTVEVTGGRWSIDVTDVDSQPMQTMRWWHGEGEQTITIKGVKRKAGATSGDADEEAGYYETMRNFATNCRVM